MSKKSGFEHLKRDFPIFEVKNKHGVTKVLELADNNTIDVPPSATIKVKSEEMHQLPDMTVFKMVNPDFKTLAKYDMFKSQDEEDTADKQTSKTTDSNSTSSSSGSKPEAPAAAAAKDATNTGGKTGTGIEK